MGQMETDSRSEVRQGAATVNITAAQPVQNVPGPGFRIGNYVIEEVLGRGAMATVYLARDDTGHEVAMKVFQEGPGVSATMLERFRREAAASKKLRRHPHILTVYETGQQGPYHYIVMETVKRSKTLAAALESTPMTLSAIVEIIIKIARALQFAHSRGIVHRDIKPTNILIDEFGEPMLSDFGVAELVDWPSCTVTGALTGTPLYMSPEQARGEHVGPASDIFSLGVVLYEAVTGVLPYSVGHRARVQDVLKAVQEEPPRRPRLFRREISPDLEAVMLKAMAKDPADRYPDAEAFAQDLERALAGKRVSARHPSVADDISFWLRKHQHALWTVVACVAVGGAVALFSRYLLLGARSEALVTLARLRSLQEQMVVQSNNQGGGTHLQAWDILRQARRAGRGGDWALAAQMAGKAADLFARAQEPWMQSVALLEEARAWQVAGNLEEAMAAYENLVALKGASLLMKEQARWDLICYLVRSGSETEAALMVKEYPPSGPFLQLVRILAGEVPPEDLRRLTQELPRFLRNDAWMALAIRAGQSGTEDVRSMALEETLRSSVPAGEWPAPLAAAQLQDLKAR